MNHSRREPVNLEVKSLRTCSRVTPGVVNLLSIHALNSCILERHCEGSSSSNENHASGGFAGLCEDDGGGEEVGGSSGSSTIGSVDDAPGAYEPVLSAISRLVRSARSSEDALVGKDCVSCDSCSVCSEAELSSDSEESVGWESAGLEKTALDSKWKGGSSLLDSSLLGEA